MRSNYDFSKGIKNPYKTPPLATVYFDRNVFGDICELRGGVSAEDVGIVQQAVRSGALTIPASITLFEETIRVLKESDEKYDQHMKTVFSLIHAAEMVKPPNQLLRDDCQSYAERSPYDRITATPAALRDILDVSKNKQDLLSLADEIARRFKASAASITQGLLAARVAGEQRDVGTPGDFDQLWTGLSPAMVEGLLTQVGRPIRRLCKKRGLEGMLKITSIRLYTIYYSWLVHSGWFGVQGNPRKMKEGDVGDFFHVVQASAATIFVTQESKEKPNKLPSILSQIPIEGFEIMNLTEFVQYLKGITKPQTTSSPAEAA
jgi:hypothetical protein